MSKKPAVQEQCPYTTSSWRRVSFSRNFILDFLWGSCIARAVVPYAYMMPAGRKLENCYSLTDGYEGVSDSVCNRNLQSTILYNKDES